VPVVAGLLVMAAGVPLARGASRTGAAQAAASE